MNLTQHSGGAAALFSAALPGSTIALAWLGQAGFALRFGGLRLLIDPYLSDHLARKYAGLEFPHTRMMQPPLDAAAIRDLDFVLCSHRHGDHMDPGALPILAANNPRCRFVVPRAEVDSATGIGLPPERLIPASADVALNLSGTGVSPVMHSTGETPVPQIEILLIPSAHETLKTNPAGEHHFLGFILRLGGLTLYHSGDCVVYDGLAERLRKQPVDLALLPVNGRSERLTSRGILGNMNFAEARDLCLAAGIPALIPHHFGMFDFNTVDTAELEQQIAALDPAALNCLLPSPDRYFEFSN